MKIKSLALLAAAALAFTGCDDDDDVSGADAGIAGEGGSAGEGGAGSGGEGGSAGEGGQGGEGGNIGLPDSDEEAEAASQDCDFLSAGNRYAEIYKANSPAEISFRFAMTGLFRLFGNENFQALLPKLGFENASVDFSFLWNATGLFAQMVGDHDFASLVDQLPHKYLTTDVDYFSETIDPSLTVGDLINTFKSMHDDLNQIAVALEKAADANLDSYVMSEAGCDLDKIKFSSTDLYTLATFAHVTNALIDLLGAYDQNINVHDLIEYIEEGFPVDFQGAGSLDEAAAHCDDLMMIDDLLMKHLFKATGTAANGRADFTNAMKVLKKATENANKATGEDFFGWNLLGDGVIEDIKRFATSVANSTDGKFTMPNIVPGLTIDLKKIFDEPTTTSYTGTSFCDVYEDYYYYYKNDDVSFSGDLYFEQYIETFLIDLARNVTGKNDLVAADKKTCDEHNMLDDEQYLGGQCVFLYVTTTPDDNYSADYSSDWSCSVPDTLLDHKDYFGYSISNLICGDDDDGDDYDECYYCNEECDYESDCISDCYADCLGLNGDDEDDCDAESACRDMCEVFGTESGDMYESCYDDCVGTYECGFLKK